MWKDASTVQIWGEVSCQEQSPHFFDICGVEGHGRIIRQHLYDHLSTNHLVSDVQHGFCPGRSCESQLLDTVHVWNKSMEDRKLVYVLFLDRSKAFDKVPHAYLLEKLKMVGIDGGLLSWIRDYLTNRNKGALLKDVFLGGFL